MGDVISAKYQIKPNVFAMCNLEIVEVDEQGVQALFGIRQIGDTSLMPGTAVYFCTNKSGTVNQSCVTVQQVKNDGKKVRHYCSPITTLAPEDRRTIPRKESEFFIKLSESKATFLAENGTQEGLKLRYKSKQAVLSLNVGKQYNFKTPHKGTEYNFDGIIRYVIYDWRKYEHILGVSFEGLDDTHQTVLNLLIDPNYKVELSDQKIDASAGKVSADS
ncbi:MAG: hypothetical protein KTR14_01485 [Vampirovibrio sp.]|nr:hypothetical protein [Vampirovibrio sp.]